MAEVRSMNVGRIPLLVLALGLLLALALALGARSADAKAPIVSYSAMPTDTQAGGHPDVLTSFRVGNRATQGYPSPCNCEDPRDIRVSLPPGVIGNPHAIPSCSASEFATFSCSPDSQIGVAAILLGGPVPNGQYFLQAVYNLEPHPGQAGLIGFRAPITGTPIFQVVSSRTDSDYGLDITVEGLTQFVPAYGVDEVLWGVPSDPSHTPLRYPFGGIGSGCGLEDLADELFGEGAHMPTSCTFQNPPFVPTPSNAPSRAFLSNPTSCEGQLTAHLHVLAYDAESDDADALWPETTGCDQLSFNPSLSGLPTTNQTDAPSGLDVELRVPQVENPSSPSPSQIRATTVTLPEGFSINPNAADGKVACSDEEGAFGTLDAARCPNYSRVGSLTIESSALPGPLPGSIFLGRPEPGDPYRIFLAADGFDVHVKLPGSVHADPRTGQLVVSFQNLPQTPFSEFDMHFFGSERGLLATPTKCGTYAVQTTFTPWDNALPDQESTQFFTLDSGPGGMPCPPEKRPFDPTLSVGTTDTTSGVHAPFTLDLGRPDGNQNLTGLTVSTPPGFAATLKGVAYCSEQALAALAGAGRDGMAELASPSCPASSQIGTAQAATGAGTHPLYSPGKVYLAGPYKSAPLSLVVAIPAVSGPYDLGNVAVRAAVHVDPEDAHITTVSDPLPQILEGIPLRLRSVMVNLDRPGFTLNPTDCTPSAVTTQVEGNEGGVARPSSRFQVASCNTLAYSPKLALRLDGTTARRGHPRLTATLNQDPGQANSARAIVRLPRSEILDQSHLEDICTRVQYAAEQCPADSVYGTATAVTPLLDQPLTGNVHLRSSGGGVPNLAVALRGQIDIDLIGKIGGGDKGMRVAFDDLPDAAITSFTLKMKGGAKGLLFSKSDLCKGSNRAQVKLVGQNGATVAKRPKVKAACGKARSKRAHRKRGGSR